MMTRLCAVLALLLFLSCSYDKKYEATIPDDLWDYQEGLSYDLASKSDTSHHLGIQIVHRSDYGYQNLYLIVESFLGVQSIQDTISFQLADDTGYWLGDCKNGLCSYTFSWFHDITQIPEKVTIHQFSRDNPLRGIRSINLIVKPR